MCHYIDLYISDFIRATADYSLVCPTLKIAVRHPDLAKRSEVPSTGCGALASIQQKDLGQAQQEEHGTQNHHALFELHLHPSSPDAVCVPRSDPPPLHTHPSPLMHGPFRILDACPSRPVRPVPSDKLF